MTTNNQLKIVKIHAIPLPKFEAAMMDGMLGVVFPVKFNEISEYWLKCKE